MTLFIRSGLSLLLLFTAASVSAEKLYKHIDKDGRVTYRDQPPAGGGAVEERVIRNRAQGEQTVLPEVVVYVSQGCDPCDLARLYLKHRGVAFTEKDASNDPAIQTELKKLAGMLSVPTITVGKTVLKGFDKSQVDSALDASGFPKAGENKDSAKPDDDQNRGGQAPIR